MSTNINTINIVNLKHVSSYIFEKKIIESKEFDVFFKKADEWEHQKY